MNDKKRKQKQYYINQAKRAKFEKRKLHSGLRGFLCTTNNKERECVREAYNLLNEYANQMYGAEHEAQVGFELRNVGIEAGSAAHSLKLGSKSTEHFFPKSLESRYYSAINIWQHVRRLL